MEGRSDALPSEQVGVHGPRSRSHVELGIDLTLAGHRHGGQLALSFINPGLTLKANDKYNSGASKAVTHALLPMLHNAFSNGFSAINDMIRRVSCITSVDPACTTDASKNFEKLFNKSFGGLFSKPTNDTSDLFRTQ